MKKYLRQGASLSACKEYRYSLWRIWDEHKSYVLFICLNPSTADDSNDDATVKKCVKYAEDWGYGGVYIANLFALRSKDPNELFKSNDPIGPDNNSRIIQLSKKAGVIVAAWGNHGSYMSRDKYILDRIPNLKCLNVNKTGQPAHPLYQPDTTSLKSFPELKEHHETSKNKQEPESISLTAIKNFNHFSETTQLEHHKLFANTVLSMVHELHKAGFQRIRISPGLSPSGSSWRVSITHISNILISNGALIADFDSETAHYTSAQENNYFGWREVRAFTPKQLAEKFMEEFPVICIKGKGLDYHYTGWFTHMLGFADRGIFPIAYQDFGNMQTSWLPTTEGANSGLPLPPPGNAAKPVY